uniref:Uncharacterized protein n=1 Tax=Siphoviridae sp. ctdau33 TaxID=2827902 RepID=A0A8S5S627_9CAUD|nr:MAG TPA: hypothetical protein [Siphoviridae sp. ctdau33]
MDAVNFIKERDRMYEVERQAPSLIYRHEKSAEEIVREVEEWSAAHPRKTRQDVFLEQWPNARPADDGVLTFCPKRFDFNISCLAECHSLKKCSDCRREFWMQEVE